MSTIPSKSSVSALAVLPTPTAFPRELDGATLVAAQRGEGWARRALVSMYQRRVHALAWRMLGAAGRRHLAEDLVQEAFIRIFGALPRFSPEGSARLSTWILSIAARSVIDELRRRQPRVAPLSAVDELDGGERPDLRSEQVSVGRVIARAVGELSPEIRAAFLLRAYHELDYAEIAEALEVSVGTVKSRLWRARAALKTALEEIR